MAISGKVTVGIFCLVFAKFAFSSEIGLNYESNNQRFILKKECVAELKVQDTDFKETQVLKVRLKKSEECSQELNDVINKNIGEHLKTYFNSNLLIDSYIAGVLRTEDGFRMPLESKTLGEDILSFYNKSN